MSIIKLKNYKQEKVQEKRINKRYITISVLGKNLALNIKYRNIKTVELNIEENEVIISLPTKLKKADNSNIINTALEKMYNEIAELEVENSMEKARIILGFAPDDYEIKRLKSDYCKTYQKNQKILINPTIARFNRTVIDNTILKAFCKLKFKENSNAYKTCMKKALKLYDEYGYNVSVKVS